ncbi:SUR7/PalI family-domain-containing protein [Aspergillus granulosus]|uniref:SUR7/PalI family-domain-containing protein n=1 Tax=Aspergillus granulosus TaxID=176169 RepID=A0ABR4GWW3_9EURO
MLLKPATPLTVLLLIAFTLLLLSVLSTPIVKNIPLATFDNVEYGVFGYCKAGKCTAIHVGYTTEDIRNTGSSDSDFNLPSDARKSLSSILIVHPIAALLTLICLCLAAAAHFHAPSHSPRYLLALLILLLPTLLVSLLAFLVDILLFVPHLSWGGWIVLAATIILVTCGVVTCAMRRTLVSRKARKRRIAENAEMSGENYYNRQNAAAAALNEPKPMVPEAKETFVIASQSSESAPTFATFRTTTRESDDDRTPLNTHPNQNQSDPAIQDTAYSSRIPGDPVPYNTPRDEYGNPLPPVAHNAGSRMRTPGPPDSRMRDQHPDSRRGNHPPGFAPRGRGGYPPRGGYGRGGPYGGGPAYGPNPRGPPGRNGSMRGGPPGMMARGGYRPSPAMAGYGPGPRPMAEDDYGNRGNVPRQLSPGPVGVAVSAEPGPVGQAIEMMPQQRHDPEPQDTMPEPRAPHEKFHEPVSPSSRYSRSPTYVPPRANWGQQAYQSSEPNLPYQPKQQSQPHHVRSHSGSLYYEDEDPVYTSRNESAVGNPRVPSALTPGNSGEPKPKEDGEERPSSPAASEVSHYTSISERPVNPKWRPPPMPAQAAQKRRDVLLENNPDFDLRAGMGRGGRMPPLSGQNVTRYPIP